MQLEGENVSAFYMAGVVPPFIEPALNMEMVFRSVTTYPVLLYKEMLLA